jgi:hypothetical protein
MKSIFVICTAIILIGLLFWPTPYRYDNMTIEGNIFPVRTFRLTGNTEYYLMGDWIGKEKSKKDQVKIKESELLPIEESSKITGSLYIDHFGSLCGEIYNGSNWIITDVILRVVVKEKKGKVRWDRRFKDELNITPLSTSNIHLKVTGNEDIPLFEWSLEEVRGHKKN